MKVLAITFAIALASSNASAQQAMKGTVTKVDELNGKITVQQLPEGTATASTEDYKVQDGLMFNALQSGDKVMFNVETMNGAKTITKLTKE